MTKTSVVCPSCNGAGYFYLGNCDTWTACKCRDAVSGQSETATKSDATGGSKVHWPMVDRVLADPETYGHVAHTLANSLREADAARVRAEDNRAQAIRFNQRWRKEIEELRADLAREQKNHAATKTLCDSLRDATRGMVADHEEQRTRAVKAEADLDREREAHAAERAAIVGQSEASIKAEREAHEETRRAVSILERQRDASNRFATEAGKERDAARAEAEATHQTANSYLLEREQLKREVERLKTPVSVPLQWDAEELGRAVAGRMEFHESWAPWDNLADRYRAAAKDAAMCVARHAAQRIASGLLTDGACNSAKAAMREAVDDECDRRRRLDDPAMVGVWDPFVIRAGMRSALGAVGLAAEKSEATPLSVRLPCPSCGELHIDEGEFATKVHHTHSCQHCGMTWRPAIAPTVGVRFLPGFKNDAEVERLRGGR